MFDRAIEQLKAFHKYREFITPAEWAGENISFKEDVSSKTDGKLDLSLTPYLKDVLNAWDFTDVVREITVVAPEQTGKTLSWVAPLLWTFEHKPCLSIVCYPSDELAEKINSEKLKPLMKQIPKLKAELDLPRSTKKDCYHFSNLKSYFMGAGSRVTSQSAKIRVGDECDDWISHEGKVTNIKDLRKRARSFDESLFAKVCSPTKSKGTIWVEFEKGSQGYWHLLCLKCATHTMRSADIHHLQWACDDNGDPIEDSIRLICPNCKHEHTEKDKRTMNINGKYIHNFPERQHEHPSFQWGALASQWATLSWLNIAKAQLEAGKTARKEEQIYLDNSIRGLPFKPRRASGKQIDNIRKHCAPLPKAEDIENVFMSCDTQDDCIYWIVRGIDSNDNTYLLDYGKASTTDELDKVWNKDYLGISIKMAIIDSGGHRTKEIERFCKDRSGFWMYKGNPRIGRKIKRSDEIKDLLLCQPKPYKSDLLYYVYSQENRENNYWFLPPDVSDKYTEQIADVKPNNNVKNGDEYENWEGGKNDHWFDCEKEMIALIEWAKKTLKSKDWRIGALKDIKKSIKYNNKPKTNGNGWVNGWKV